MAISTEPSTGVEPGRPIEEAPAVGRYRVLVTSTLAFTLMFAVWLQFGILGLPIKKEFGLSDTAFYWLTALPVLNGAIWRMGTGVLADRWGGRIVMTAMLLLAAIPTFLLSGVHNAGALFVLAFLIGFAGNSFSSGIAWNSAWFPRSQQGFALGVFGAGNVGASITKLIGPAIIAQTFREAMANAETTLEVKLVVYKLFDRFVLGGLETLGGLVFLVYVFRSASQ